MIDKLLKNNSISREMYNKALNNIDSLKDQVREQERDFRKISKELENYNSVKRDYELLQESVYNKEQYYQRSLARLQKEIDLIKDKMACTKLENGSLYKEIDELKQENKNLKSELNTFNPNLKPKAKRVDKELVIEVKNLSCNHSYREIQKIVKIGLNTVSRIVNGYYDDLLK